MAVYAPDETLQYSVLRKNVDFDIVHGARYVHGFNRGWEIGNPDYKISLPAQLSHRAGVTYIASPSYGRLSATFEIDNLTDARLYDTFGVELAGRAYNLKLIGQI